MNKKILIIISSIVIILAIGLVVFLFINKDEAEITINPGSNNPFGEGGGSNVSGPVSVPTGEEVVVSAGKEFGLLRKISNAQTAGAVLKTTASTTEIKFVERSSGHVYKTSSISNVIDKVTNTTIPKIHEAIWFPDGENFIGRYERNDLEETFIGTIVAPSATTPNEAGELLVKFLPANIRGVSISPSGKNIFMLSEQINSFDFRITDSKGEKPSLVWESAVGSWNLSWPSESKVFVSTKASAEAESFLYSINTKSKALGKIVGGKAGSSFLVSPDAQNVLYSNPTGGPVLYLYNIKNDSSRILPISTLPEKCAWSKNSKILYCAAPKTPLSGELPDIWYQGLVSFSDKIWLLDLETDAPEELADPMAIASEEIDAIKLTTESSGMYLGFINKKDSSLWILQLSN